MQHEIEVYNASMAYNAEAPFAKVSHLKCHYCGAVLDGVQIKMQNLENWCVFNIGICACTRFFRYVIDSSAKLKAPEKAPPNEDRDFDKFRERFENGSF